MACSHSYIGRKHNMHISMKGNGCMEEDSGKYQFSWFVQVRSLGKCNLNAILGKQYRIGNKNIQLGFQKMLFTTHKIYLKIHRSTENSFANVIL